MANTIDIEIARQTTPERLEELGVFQWSIWTKEISEFPWTYDFPNRLQ